MNTDLVARLTTRLREPLPGDEAHARFSPRPPRGGRLSRVAPPDVRHAAALILLYPNSGEAIREQEAAFSLPLTVRRADLPDHAGQISLPGGRIDVGETAEAAALREAAEEIGIDPARVQLLGSLTPLYVFVSRFLVTPFVGIADARPDFLPAPREVAEIIEVPVDQLRNRSNLQWGHRTREGYLIDFPYFRIADHQVWGATAMMLGEFMSLLDPGFGPSEINRS